MTGMPGALDGYRVLDLSNRLSAAFCARLFGDQGADVILAECGDGHPARSLAPFLDGVPGVERSLVHAYANLNKRSVLLPADDARLAELVGTADVVVVSDAETTASIRPRLRAQAVMAAVTAYGITGSWQDAPGNDLTAFSSTGWALLNAEEGRPPLSGVQNSASYLAGIMAYTGATAALITAPDQGEPELVDVSETEVLGWLGANGILASAFGEGARTKPQKPGIFNPPTDVRDGYITISFSRTHFWTEAMRALGLHEIAADPRYFTQEGRAQHGHQVSDEIEDRLRDLDRWEAFRIISDAGATAGVVADMGDVADSKQLRGRGLFHQTTVEGRRVETMGAPGLMGATPWVVRRAAPTLGEHTGEALADWGVA